MFVGLNECVTICEFEYKVFVHLHLKDVLYVKGAFIIFFCVSTFYILLFLFVRCGTDRGKPFDEK